MTTRFIRSMAILAISFGLGAEPALAADNADTQAILKEIRALKQSYEKRIADLESKIKQLEAGRRQAALAASPAATGRSIRDNSFNPSIGLILNGKASAFSSRQSEFAGFAIGEEGERGREGLAIDESELNFSSNVDDKFYGSLTAAIVREDGEDKVELEEAFVETLPGLGLPDGMRLKAGRALWTFGYLNEKHTHTDDFVDRPLPYRAFLNNAFNDDGLQLSWVLPTDLYAEVGGGAFRGDDFPFGDGGSGVNAWSGFARIGGDIGDDSSWRLGGYVLGGNVRDRSGNEDTVAFTSGDTTLVGADLRYVWAPTGNPKESELTFQAEYVRRHERGTYDDSDAGTGPVGFDGSSSGWYAQTVYKFDPRWRIGGRFSQLYPADVPAGLVGSALDSGGYDPYTVSVMGDWTHSEFSRLRLQYNFEELARNRPDHQFVLQYIMSIGAHGAHAY